jgi:hypothetical protein
MRPARLILGYVGAMVFVVGAAEMGRTGDHGPGCGNTVCVPTADQKKVVTKTYSCKVEEFCETPLRRLFGTADCGPVLTKRKLVIHKHTNMEPITKYIPAVSSHSIPCAEPACPPGIPGQPVPGAVPNFIPPYGPGPGAGQPGPGASPYFLPPSGPAPGTGPVYPGQFPQ